MIVNGSVTIDPSVANVQGLYVMDGDFVTETNGATDEVLNVGGSVVAWGSVNLGRDLMEGNLDGPAEKFAYRPDLLINMSESMKVSQMEWSEVVPGTYGN